jgi:DNA-binding CsgD family transcriptional regulator/tetratricopeptide (TPR) repeat protein
MLALPACPAILARHREDYPSWAAAVPVPLAHVGRPSHVACRTIDWGPNTCQGEAVGLEQAGETAAGGQLLERSHHLSALRGALATTLSAHRGVLLLLAGEAGGGKTTLLRRFCADCQPVDRVLWGACDPLFTPRPLGPFIDIAQETAGELRDLVAAGAKPYQIAAAVRSAAQASRGMIIVLEDLHWADEATLDVVSLLGRRVEAVPALVIATYRDDELDRAHPLRRLLGELPGTTSIRRLRAQPLSPEAVAALAAPHGLDAGALHRVTAGNPFFVTEVIAAPSADIPPTVRDAVMARAARLSGVATTVMEAVSIALPQAELWLLDALVTDAAGALEQCLNSGILEVVPGGVAFRHELARLAIEESLSPHRRIALHRRALQALATPPSGTAGLTRLAYHAEAAGDTEAVLRFAPAAARYAASTGAHRESAAQYARALRFGSGLSPGVRAALLEGRSHECYLTDDMGASIDALRQAITYWRACGDEAREAAALSQLSRRLWCGGRAADAAKAGQEAVRLLEGRPPGRELALAYSNLSSLYMNDERFDETVLWGTRALDLAGSCGDTAVTVHSLNNIGTMQLLAGMSEGWKKLERSLALAERAGLDEPVGRAFIHLGWAMTRTRMYQREPWLDRGAKVCAELGLEAWELYVVAHRARLHLDLGRWSDAAADATFVLRSARSVPLLRLLALTVLGLVRARRGDPQQWDPLDEAFALLEGQEELQYRAPVATARAEAAWLSGRGPAVDDITRDVLDAAVDRHASWVVGELAWLRRLAGVQETVPGVIEPYSAQLAGDASGAAARWTQLSCPYDAALAFVASDDEHGLRLALAEFQRLGARPAAGIVARHLREHGVRNVPRGPRPHTEHHPARLTRREAEVLAYVQQGASNAEIAARLYLSEKTVHHHVSAILRKLGVGSRGQAVFAAAQRGLLAAAGGGPHDARPPDEQVGLSGCHG